MQPMIDPDCSRRSQAIQSQSVRDVSLAAAMQPLYASLTGDMVLGLLQFSGGSDA